MAYDFKKVEDSVLKFWKKNQIHVKLKKKNAKGKKFFFLDGPPYATGDPHPGTAINRGLKDLVRRYKWLKGYNVWDQPGFDMHGLPIESMVEKKLGLKNKQEIIDFGVAKFVKECKKYAFQYLGVMGDVFSRLGEWADWDNPYETTNNNYIEGAWWALKKAWDRKALYKGSRVLTWCPHCGTALASNYEIDHKSVREPSIYVKFKLKDKTNTYLVIWTTTPWTLSSNMAVMVNPDITYAYVKTGGETWVIAKELVEKVMELAESDYKIVKNVKGKSLKGLVYEHPFLTEVPYHRTHESFVVLSKEYVNTDSGSGLVHCAPGCGPEDQEVGNANGIASFNPINEHCVFTKDGGKLAGLRAKVDDRKFTEILKAKGVVVAEERVEHEYPHCERCKSAVVFRNTDQWFIKVTKYRDKMISENKKVNWVPKWAGANQFNNWLKSIRDWCITRQRFWGIPLPVWVCSKCDKVVVIGSMAELKKYTGKMPTDLHKPYIDKFKWKCKCGGEFVRNPDVIDVWIDSACAPFASLPKPRDKWMKELGKIDFITESKDQIRGWFYSLMGIGVVSLGECPYTNIFMHGYICDEKGAALSKRKGNYMSMPEIFDQIGADVFRTSLMLGLTPGVDSKFILDEVKNTYKALNVVWSTHDFLLRNLKYYKVKPGKPVPKTVEDKWLLSRLNSVIKVCDQAMTDYHLENYAPAVLSFLVEDLSRFYIKLIRNRLPDDPQTVLNLIYYTYINALKLLGPVAPFMTDKVYQNLSGPEESLFLDELPVADQSLIKSKLEKDLSLTRELITATLAAREKAGLSIRWPLSRVLTLKELPKGMSELFLNYVNAKTVDNIKKVPKGVKLEFKPDFNSIKQGFDEVLASKIIPKLMTLSKESINKSLAEKGFLVLKIDGQEVVLTEQNFLRSESLPDVLAGHAGVYVRTELSDELLAEGYARELVRRIQQARKKMGLKKSARIQTSLKVPGKLEKLVKPHLKMIKEVTGSKSLDFKPSGKYDVSQKYKIKDYEVTVKVRQ